MSIERVPFPGASFCENLPGGAYAVLYPGSHIASHLGRIALPAAELEAGGLGVWYPRISLTIKKGWQMCGQSHAGPQKGIRGTWHYRSGSWALDSRLSNGQSAAIFDSAGELQIIEPGPNQPSQGYRHIGDDGQLVTGDKSYGPTADGLSEYTETGGLMFGQSHDSLLPTIGALVRHQSGLLRMIEPGHCTFLRVTMNAGRIAVAMVKPDGALLLWLDVADLRTLPLVTVPAVVPPVDIPPVTPKEPETMDLPADVHAIVVALHAKHPTLANGNDEQRRELALLIAQTVRSRKGPLWGWKSNHGIAIAPAKDAIARQYEGDEFMPNARQRLWIWDLFNGSTRKPNPLPLASGPESESRQYFIPVDPIDHLGAGTVEPPTPQTHAYDGGENDTGQCDVIGCGKPKADPVHIEDEVIPPVAPLPDGPTPDLSALRIEVADLRAEVADLHDDMLARDEGLASLYRELAAKLAVLPAAGTPPRYRIVGRTGTGSWHSHPAGDLRLEIEP